MSAAEVATPSSWLSQAAAHPLRETRFCRPGSRVSREWCGLLLHDLAIFGHAKQLVAAFLGCLNRSTFPRRRHSMRTKLLAATALAGSLAMASFIWGSAQATPAALQSQAPSNGIVTLVGHG